MSFIPPHLSESNFRRYERVLAEAVLEWPQRKVVDPKDWGLSPVTMSHGLRNAKQSLIKYAWDTKLVNVDRFMQIEHDLVVRHKTDGLIYIGSLASTADGFDPITTLTTKDEQAVPYDCLDITALELFLLMKLAHNRCLSRPIRVNNILNPENYIAQWDIALVKQTDGSYLLT